MLKKIVIKIILLLLVITGLDFVYNVTFYEKDLAENSAEWSNIKKLQSQTDVFYFGESSNATYLDTDSVKTSIADMAAWFFPGLRVTMINKNASHAGIYREWLNVINLKENKPKALVITLNLRAFDATWINSRLETPLQQSVVFTKPYPHLLNRFFLSLQAFDHQSEHQRERDMLKSWGKTKLQFPFPFKYKTVRQWDDGLAYEGFRKPDCSRDTVTTTLACHYIKSYAFNLNEKNPRIRDFDYIAGWCSRQGIQLYLNLLAENVEYADSLVGKELVFLMRQNRDYLVARYTKGNCKVVDNLEQVDGKWYIDQDWTSEHYNYKGRMRIARQLAESMKQQFIDQYKKAY